SLSEAESAVPALPVSQAEEFPLRQAHNRRQCIPDAWNRPVYRSPPYLRSIQKYDFPRLPLLCRQRTYASDRFHLTPTQLRRSEESFPHLLKLLSVLPPNRFQRQQYRRSEEHTSELQSRFDSVCRLLL